MTNLDTSLEPVAPNLPKRPGLWRVISLLAVVAALIVAGLSVLQSRDASNVVVPDRDPVSLESARVTVTDLMAPDGSSLAVLGLAESDSRRQLSAEGTEIGLPDGMAAVVALNDPAGDLIGLALVAEGEGRGTIQISASSTAQALLVLSPGILHPNLAESFVNLAVIESDPAFDKLVAALRTNSNLSNSNELVEQAYAEITDRLPARRPASDQGCDSVIARDAYPSAGTCVQPEATGLLIANEQDRWALIYNESDGPAELCAIISPTNTDGAEVLIPTEQCTGDALMVAPGPVPNQGDGQDLIDSSVRSAAAVNQLYDYAGPFADLAGASAGFANESVSHIRRNSTEIVGSLTLLIESNDEFAAAMDTTRIASTALDRHTAAISAARRIIETADTTALIPQRIPGEDSHVDILDFFVRAGERMVAPRTDWRWEADSSGRVDFRGEA